MWAKNVWWNTDRRYCQMLVVDGRKQEVERECQSKRREGRRKRSRLRAVGLGSRIFVPSIQCDVLHMNEYRFAGWDMLQSGVKPTWRSCFFFLDLFFYQTVVQKFKSSLQVGLRSMIHLFLPQFFHQFSFDSSHENLERTFPSCWIRTELVGYDCRTIQQKLTWSSCWIAGGLGSSPT